MMDRFGVFNGTADRTDDTAARGDDRADGVLVAS